MTEIEREAAENFIEATSGAEVQLSLGRLLLNANNASMADTDRMNLELLMVFLKQVDQK